MEAVPMGVWVAFDAAYPPPNTPVLAFGAVTALYDVVKFSPEIATKPLINMYGYHYQGDNMPKYWRFLTPPRMDSGL